MANVYLIGKLHDFDVHNKELDEQMLSFMEENKIYPSESLIPTQHFDYNETYNNYIEFVSRHKFKPYVNTFIAYVEAVVISNGYKFDETIKQNAIKFWNTKKGYVKC